MADRVRQGSQMQVLVLWTCELADVPPDIRILVKDVNIMPNMVHCMYELWNGDHPG
jgi:ribosomal protein S19